MKIVIGADHRGLAYKKNLIETFKQYAWVDVGTNLSERTDYPLYAQKVVKKIQANNDINHGVLLCGSGAGMAVAANRYYKIYAAVACNAQMAYISTEHDHINVIVIPTDFVSEHESVDIINAWLEAQDKLKADRYAKRIAMIDAIGGIQ